MTAPAPNYYANNPLNRLSYLRTSPAFLASALASDRARFVLYNNLNPLCAPPAPTDGSIKLHTVSWADVQSIVGAADVVFNNVDGKNEKELGEVSAFWVEANVTRESLTVAERAHHFINQPPLVFLGVDERSAPAAAKSLPLTKPDEHSTLSSHSPYGVPYWALDVTTLKDLREKFLKTEDKYEFVDMRAGMASIPGEEASIAAEGRALVDWNKRNVFCPACSRPMRSVWAGWKKVCVPGVATSPELEAPPACISKKGIHNFSYPRTDPVCIMAVLSPDREKILLGRQRAWPKKFYSCLAGFVETGETLEEAARREIYEEAGIEIGDVYYHSSQPWPYPSSLMIGSICVAKENQVIRTDLDNELEDARWFTRADVLAVLNGDGRTHLSRDEVSAIDGKEDAKALKDDFEKTNAAAGSGWFRMPPVTAIANVLIEAWARNTYLNGVTSGKL